MSWQEASEEEEASEVSADLSLERCFVVEEALARELKDCKLILWLLRHQTLEGAPDPMVDELPELWRAVDQCLGFGLEQETAEKLQPMAKRLIEHRESRHMEPKQ